MQYEIYTKIYTEGKEIYATLRMYDNNNNALEIFCFGL